MNAIYAALICIAGALVCAVLRQQRPELAMGAALAAGTAAIMVCLGDIRQAAGALSALVSAAGLDAGYSALMLRACGLALIAEFATQICVDAGESALAGRIRLALRLALIVMAVPMLADVLSQSASLMEF